MDLQAKFNRSTINRYIDAKLKRMFEAMLGTVVFVGERFVTNVRTKITADPSYREAMKTRMRLSGASIGAAPLSLFRVKPNMSGNITEATPRYRDVTTALTSSVGFLVQFDGQVVRDFFPVVGKGTTRGVSIAKGVAAKYPQGIVLVVVAGMEYAAAVESKGYDVLTGSSFIAERELKEALQALTKK